MRPAVFTRNDFSRHEHLALVPRTGSLTNLTMMTTTTPVRCMSLEKMRGR